MAMAETDRAFVRHLLIAVAIGVLLVAVWRTIDLLLLMFTSVLVAILLRAIADLIHRFTRAPPRLALSLAVLGLLLLGAGSMWLFGAEVAQQFRTLGDALPEAWSTLQRRFDDMVLGERVREGLINAMPDGSGLLAGVRTALFSVGNGIAGLLLVFVGGIYLAGQPGLYRAGLLKLVPTARRPLLAQSLDETGRALRLWLRGQLLAMVVIGTLTGVGLALIGIPSAFALGLLAGLLEFVPLVGPIVAALPALLIALAQGNDVALLTLALYVAIQQVEGNVLMPMVQQRMVDVPPALTLFAVVAAGMIFGILGVLIAAPLTVALYVLVKRLYVREALDTRTSIPGEKADGEPGGRTPLAHPEGKASRGT
jgi:predicted PurR-regulated permease PerM